MPAPEPAPKRAKRADATTPEKDVVAAFATSAPAPLSTSLENAPPTRDDDAPTRDDGVDEALPTRDDDDTLPTVASDGVDEALPRAASSAPPTAASDGVDEALLRRTMDRMGPPPPSPAPPPPPGATADAARARRAAARLQAACPTSALQNSRRALNLEASDAALRAAVAAYVASSGAGALARAYVGGGALEVQGVQDIRVVARCGPQELHRDHQMGPRKGAVIALSLDGAPLGTEFVAGTHLVEEGAALSRYVADNRYATKRAPKAAAMERHLRAARLLAAADASLMVYDPSPRPPPTAARSHRSFTDRAPRRRRKSRAAPTPETMLGQPGGEAYDAPSEGPSALSHLLRVVNVGLSVMMAATGASSLASSGAVNGNQLSQDVVSLYLLLFSAMWFTFEASQVYPCDAVVAQLKRNFGRTRWAS
ncbi:hypothetical protein JL721_3735 [Aureococcus anophagefferens]|nr:hypothetical protein JL721_3735 [Aureococcus anophagefferens]